MHHSEKPVDYQADQEDQVQSEKQECGLYCSGCLYSRHHSLPPVSGVALFLLQEHVLLSYDAYNLLGFVNYRDRSEMILQEERFDFSSHGCGRDGYDIPGHDLFERVLRVRLQKFVDVYYASKVLFAVDDIDVHCYVTVTCLLSESRERVLNCELAWESQEAVHGEG